MRVISLGVFAIMLAVASAEEVEKCMAKYGTKNPATSGGGKKDITGWIIGIILCVGSAFSSVLGITFQKKAHVANMKTPEKDRKSYVKIPIWWIGLLGIILGAILDFVSLGFAPQTVVASLGSMTLVINAVVAPIALKEKLARLEKLSTMVITAGAAIAVASSSQKSQDYNLDILECLYRETGFITYAAIITTWCITLWILFRHAEHLEKQENPSYYPAWAKIHPITITALSGTLGAQSLLFAKGVSIVLRGVYDPGPDSEGGKAFTRYLTYIMLVSMVFCILSQTYTLNMALERFDSVIVLPLFQVFWIMMGVFGAGAYFKEFDGMTTTSFVLFPIGIFIIAAGIVVLSTRVPDTQLEAEFDKFTVPSELSQSIAIETVDESRFSRRNSQLSRSSRILSLIAAGHGPSSLLLEPSLNDKLATHKDRRRRTLRLSVSSQTTGAHLGVGQHSPGRGGLDLAPPDRSHRNPSIVTLNEEDEKEAGRGL